MSRHRAMAVAALLLACGAARAGERDRLRTVHGCNAAILALPDTRSINTADDPDWKPYTAVMKSPFCMGAALVLAREMLVEHPELRQ
jgi:hypothetical protein